MSNMLTMHARQRAEERLSFLAPGNIAEVLAVAESQEVRRKYPLWADTRRRHGLKLEGVVLIMVWQPWEKREGWQRQRKVAFPAVRKKGQIQLTTCVLGPFTGRQRLAPHGSRT